MGELVVTGAKLQCPFGTIMTSLCVTSQSKCLAAGKPAATVADVKPNVNIPAFGMCSSPANPQVMGRALKNIPFYFDFNKKGKIHQSFYDSGGFFVRRNINCLFFSDKVLISHSLI